MIRRHSRGAILFHWFNGGCWFALLVTGLALIENPGLQPLGEWWTEFWRLASPGAGTLLLVHVLTGLVWAAGCLAFVLFRLHSEAVPFLREVLTFSPRNDARWIFRKTLWLTVGEARMRALGIEPELPAQGFYNAGQKAFAIPAVACGLGLVCTGLALTFSRAWAGGEGVAQWSLVLHFFCAMLVAVGLPVHIYMAAFAPGEGPALRSMFTGFVPLDFVRHHNALWHCQLQAEADLHGREDDE